MNTVNAPSCPDRARPLGVIIAQGREAAFTEADEAILAHLAQTASTAIERALPYR
jgi:GAF domain-containing protein